jgi:hypothetical protein
VNSVSPHVSQFLHAHIPRSQPAGIGASRSSALARIRPALGLGRLYGARVGLSPFYEQEDNKIVRQTLSKGMVAAAAATGILSLCNPLALAHSNADSAAESSPRVLSGDIVRAPVHAPVNVCGNNVKVGGIGNKTLGNSCADEPTSKKSHGASRHGASRHGASGQDDGKGAHGPDALGSSEVEKHGPSAAHKRSGAPAYGQDDHSPDDGYGSAVEAPVHIPVDVCGITVDVTPGRDFDFDFEFDEKCVSGDHSKKPVDAPEDYGNTPGSPDTPSSPDSPNTSSSPGVHDTPSSPGVHDTPDTPRQESPDTALVTSSAKTPTTPGKPSVTRSAMAETGAEGVIAASAAGAAMIAAGAVAYRRSRAASRR